MTTVSLKTVVLPDGDKVTVSIVPEDWWTKHNASGYVSPNTIAPDPKNPRRHISPARQVELNESIKTRGVRQQLIVTPRHLAPWASVLPEQEHCFFLAVSGHRRRHGAMEASLGAVPIKVAVYKSEKDHRMDMSLLNKGQDDLSPLEEGYEIVTLQDLGWKVDDLSKSFGLAVPQLYGRMHLTKLHPDIQAMLDPELPRERRLAVTLGGFLGGVKVPTVDELEELFVNLSPSVKREEITTDVELEKADENGLRFLLQKLLLAVIRRRNLSSDQAVEFIRDRTLQLKAHHGAAAKKPQRFQPQRRKDILESLIKEVTGSVVVDWPPQEIRRIFELSSREEVEEFMQSMQRAGQIFITLAEILVKIRDEKKPSHPDVIRLMERKKFA